MDLLERFKIQVECNPGHDPKYVSPNGSKWIIAVADDGIISVLSIPNIHYSFTDDARTADEWGFGEEIDLPPGIYECTCNFEYSTDWETGFMDEWGFVITESKLLWTWEKDGKENTERRN